MSDKNKLQEQPIPKPLNSSPNQSMNQQEVQEDKKPIKYKQTLFLGSLLPGQSTSVSYAIQEIKNSIQFITAQLNNSTVAEGFSLSKNQNSEQKVAINLIVKPKAIEKFVIHIFAQNVPESTEIKGQIKLSIGKESFTVMLVVKIQVPRIFCPKFLHSQPEGLNILRIIINKLATNQGRITMMNTQKYPMQFQAQIVGKSLIDKDCPYNISCVSNVITASPQKPFTFNVSISTNIFFKGSMNNLKKVICRKLILLKTNSSIIYNIPLEVIIVFVKQPQIKQ